MTLLADRLPRLLAGLENSASADLEVHRSVYGDYAERFPVGGAGRRGRRDREGSTARRLIEELTRADLHGHGGAWFPTARKLAAVAEAGSRARSRPNVVVTVTEGEALSGKDSLLARRLPHLLVDGALSVAGVLDAERVVFAFADSKPRIGQALADAIAGRPELDGGGRSGLRMAVEAVPHRYIAGQETALVAALNGRAGSPSFTPPYPFERGLGRHPTFVSNAETFAQIGLIATHGADWYRAIGTASAPGTRLVSISGAVGRRSVIEIAGGSSLESAIGRAGGLGEAPVGVLLGGCGGTWVAAEPDGALPDLVLDEPSLRACGLTLGPGIVWVLGRSDSPVTVVADTVRTMAGQSAGQCGPCVNGLGALADELGRFSGRASGRGRGGGSVDRVLELCDLVERRGACAHPDGVARFVRSALLAFGPEFAECAGDRRPAVVGGGIG